jgi:2-oxoacid:acceptor oxidoreductase delta subunit (pyruvate/2-ketoisovalerate family)
MKFLSEYEAPWSDCKNRIDMKTGEWRYQRPVTKVFKCRQCGQCYIYCPSGCREVKETHFEADLEYCKGCGICAQVCPGKAITLVREEE